MHKTLSNKALHEGGVFASLFESQKICLNESRKDFGVTKVVEGTLSLFLYKDSAKHPTNLIKTYKEGDLIMAEAIQNKCFDNRFILVAGDTGCRVVKMEYSKFKEIAFKGNLALTSMVESAYEGVSLMINKQLASKGLSPEEKYMIAIYKQLDMNETTDSVVDIRCGREEIEATTGMGKRTVARAHSNLIKKGILFPCAYQKTISVDPGAIISAIQEKNLSGFAL